MRNSLSKIDKRLLSGTKIGLRNMALRSKLSICLANARGSRSLANKMPNTSSGDSPITGKRECDVSVIVCMNSWVLWSALTTAIWGRGTIMSRTCMCDICKAPSIVSRASRSSIWSSSAWRIRSNNSSLLLGRSLRKKESLSSQERLSWLLVDASSFIRVVFS